MMLQSITTHIVEQQTSCKLDGELGHDELRYHAGAPAKSKPTPCVLYDLGGTNVQVGRVPATAVRLKKDRGLGAGLGLRRGDGRGLWLGDGLSAAEEDQKCIYPGQNCGQGKGEDHVNKIGHTIPPLSSVI